MIEVLKEGTVPTATWCCETCNSELRAKISDNIGYISKGKAPKFSFNLQGSSKFSKIYKFICPVCKSNTFVPEPQFTISDEASSEN